MESSDKDESRSPGPLYFFIRELLSYKVLRIREFRVYF